MGHKAAVTWCNILPRVTGKKNRKDYSVITIVLNEIPAAVVMVTK